MTPQKKTTQNPGAQVDIHQRTSAAPTQGVPAQDIDQFLRQGMQTVQEVNRSLQRVHDEIAYLVNARLATTPPTAFAQQQVPLPSVAQQPTPWSALAGIPGNAAGPTQAIYGASASPPFANPWPGAHQDPYQNPYQNPYQSPYQNPYALAQPAQSIPPVPQGFGVPPQPPSALGGTSYGPNLAAYGRSSVPHVPQAVADASRPAGFGAMGAETFGQGFGQTGSWQQTPQTFGQSRPFGPEFQPTSTRPFRLARDLREAAPLRRQPSLDLVDEGDAFLVRLEIPGVTKEDLDVTCFDDCVVVSALSGAGIEGDEGALLMNERGSIEYRRVIDLPSNIEADSCKANLKDGILTLHLGKQTPSAAPRHLDVMYG